MKLQSVEEFFHKRETVEKYNVDNSHLKTYRNKGAVS